MAAVTLHASWGRMLSGSSACHAQIMYQHHLLEILVRDSALLDASGTQLSSTPNVLANLMASVVFARVLCAAGIAVCLPGWAGDRF